MAEPIAAAEPGQVMRDRCCLAANAAAGGTSSPLLAMPGFQHASNAELDPVALEIGYNEV
jgi:hypothetical protein